MSERRGCRGAVRRLLPLPWLVLLAGGCSDLLWPRENPQDQHRCGDDCPDGQLCYAGGCVECVDDYLNGASCASLGFTGGHLTCGPALRFDTSRCFRCGDHEINGNEDCEGTNLGGQSCFGLGFIEGELSCSAYCLFDISGCIGCGNGRLEPQVGEECDGGVPADGCVQVGFDGGELRCAGNCKLDTSGCYRCGDGVINGPQEECDGGDFGGDNCLVRGFDSGLLSCTDSCTIDSTSCGRCGDGEVNGGEECEPGQFVASTCLSLGFDGGILRCTNCTIDTHDCYRCGDGQLNGPDEECDLNYAPQACQSGGYTYGTTTCRSDCTIDDTSCHFGWAAVPPGSFAMGADSSEPCQSVDAQQSVTLTKAFEMLTHEVTQNEFVYVLGGGGATSVVNPSALGACGGSCPVETVTWHQAAAFCNALSVIHALGQCYSCSGVGANTLCQPAGGDPYGCEGWRLPTEAEWELAYRAGSGSAYYNGANEAAACFSCGGAEPNAKAIGWFCSNSAVSYPGCINLGTWGGATCAGTHPVGQKQPNALGLYDMAGNVAEWCDDWYGALGAAPATDPTGAGNTGLKVVRGGSWADTADQLRAAHRSSKSPGATSARIGFRCARSVQEGS